MHRVIFAALGLAMLAAGTSLTGATSAQAAKASFYSWDFAGKLTANGERFNPRAMTAASRTLPFGTMVRVTNRANGRSVVVRINDRGPFIAGRSIDLSLGAAGAIGMIGSGVAGVDIVVLGRGSRSVVAAKSHKAKSVQVARKGPSKATKLARAKLKAKQLARLKAKRTVIAKLRTGTKSKALGFSSLR